jgi:hypothetical protein
MSLNENYFNQWIYKARARYFQSPFPNHILILFRKCNDLGLLRIVDIVYHLRKLTIVNYLTKLCSLF